MSSPSKVNWIEAQKKTFENWTNQYLKERNLEINDLQKDFKNGVKLYSLYQGLTHKRIKQMDAKPRIKISCLNNLNLVINGFKADGVKIVNVQGEDIYDENLKLILGFIWTLILFYHILDKDKQKNDKSGPKKLLLNFVNERIGPEMSVKNFAGDWMDGIALSTLIENIQPGSYPQSDRPDDSLKMIKKALQVASEKCEIPQVIEPEFIHEGADELSLMTYTTYLKKKYEENLLKVHAPLCIVSGLNDAKNTENPHSFNIELRNIYNSLCPVILEDNPLKDINVTFDGPQSVQYRSTPVKDSPGHYTINYEAIVPGEYTININIPSNGPYVHSNPFLFKLTGDEMEITGKGIQDGEYIPSAERIINIDSKIPSPGLFDDDCLSCLILSPDGTELVTKKIDHSNGKYSINYIPLTAGDYSIKISLSKKEIFSKSISLKKKRNILVKLSGDIVDKNRFYDNSATGFIVNVQDDNGVPVNDADVSVSVDFIDHSKKDQKEKKSSENNQKNEKSPKKDQKEKKPSENDQKNETPSETIKAIGKIDISKAVNGNYEVNIDEIETLGKYEIKIKIDEKEMEFPAECLKGTQSEMVEGKFVFEVQSKDKNGENKNFGGDLWQVEIKGPNGSEIEVETIDVGDGTYRAIYCLRAIEGEEGVFVVNARLNGVHVASSPFKHQLSPKKSIGKRLKNFFKRK